MKHKGENLTVESLFILVRKKKRKRNRIFCTQLDNSQVSNNNQQLSKCIRYTDNSRFSKVKKEKMFMTIISKTENCDHAYPKYTYNYPFDD